MSRRGLLVNAGKIAAGAAVISVGARELIRPAQASAAAWPYGYTKLDPQEVGDLAYKTWYGRYCCQAVAQGILQPLAKKMGGPYADLPLDAFKWGHGGVVGWGTLCGTMVGAGIALGFIAGNDGEKILNDVIAFYANSALPIYRPSKPKSHFKNVNTADSPLCHISVGKWMKKEGVKFFSPERKERCACISADVAMHTAKLLNAWKDGAYKPGQGSNVREHGITTQENCMECHGDDVPTPIT
ncbi:MAG: C-GCAxxG-C-C family protein [Desulfobacterales bacterium]|nr:C-GCAxxG-C-C family protein [Desulfobacterales bacterium]